MNSPVDDIKLYITFLLQLKQELKKGRAFDGWSEGVMNFSPTYKYESNSEKYVGEDPKTRRRNPAWYEIGKFPYYPRKFSMCIIFYVISFLAE